MRLTIVFDDAVVGIDGECFSPIDLSQFDPSIHAVQWYGEYGEIEFKTVFSNGLLTKAQNQIITDIAPFQFAIDAWSLLKEQAVEAEEAEEAARVAAQAAANAAAEQEVLQQEPLQNDGV